MLRNFVAKYPNWMLLVASDILAEVTRQDFESLRTGTKARIEKNQQLAVQKIDSIRKTHPKNDIVLDAHCIIDNGDELVRVPLAAIQELNPTALVYIWDEAERIHDKRLHDRVRTRPKRTVQQLRLYQQAVIETCEDYRSQLGLDLASVRAGDAYALEKALGPSRVYD
jgi:adenylate kinase